MPAPSPVLAFATASAAMVQIQKHLHRLLDDGVRLLAFDMDHEPNTARLMFETADRKGLVCPALSSAASSFFYSTVLLFSFSGEPRSPF